MSDISQHYRVAEVGRHLWRSCSLYPLPKQTAQDCPIALLVKKVISLFILNFLYLICAHWFFVQPPGTTEKSLLLSSLLELSLLHGNNPSSLSLSLYNRFPDLSIIFVSPSPGRGVVLVAASTCFAEAFSEQVEWEPSASHIGMPNQVFLGSLSRRKQTAVPLCL